MSRWKEASSLILSAACKNRSNIQVEFEKYKFDILALKKKENIQTVDPQMVVFPGGTVSSADTDKDWEFLFSNFGLNLNFLSNSLKSKNATRLPIFSKSREGIPRYLSLRITAIRETFEECGLLLCRRVEEDQNFHGGKQYNNIASHLAIDDLESWRKRVLKDPYKFFSLCECYQCYPDVEKLILWSNWLTPSHLTERYDAVFFYTEVDKLNTSVSPDNEEISSTEWLTPSELLNLANNGDIFLRPPQWYEINSLHNIITSDGLKRIIYNKSNNCHVWMPVRILASDGEISLLPGDDMYPDEIDPFFPSPINKKEQAMYSLRCKRMHRLEHIGSRTKLIDTRS